jgi:hypothetical protein
MDGCSVATKKSDKALVHSFGVGHGDCTLLEYSEPHGISFRMLVDGGARLPDALIKHLKNCRRPEGSPQIDVVVLTHVDYDHLGGLTELLDKSISIGEYWGPCLPAFRRLRGIFKLERIQRGIDTAEQLEKDLTAAGVKIFYPLEGYLHRFCENKVVVSVISPAARLIRRLLTASDADLAELLVRRPLPLEWLFGPEPDELDHLFPFSSTATMTTPDEAAAFRPRPVQLRSHEIEQRAREIMGDTFEPEFFGNAVLNDTSLVMTVDFHIDRMRRRRVLLTGDQENWSYIAYQNPNGLGADVLKAPHHGGRVYLADDGEDAVDQLYLWLRSPTVITSASGLYNLPRLSFRNALRTSGSNLLCPNVRTFEPLSAGAVKIDGAVSCHAAYGCSQGKTQQHEMITVALNATEQSANVAACVQGTGHAGLAPIRVLQQRIVDPDQSFVRWTQTEVEKYAKWLQKELEQQSKATTSHIIAGGEKYLDALNIVPIPWRELKDKAIVAGHFNLAANPHAVLSYAVSRGMIWSNLDRQVNKDTMVYRRPTDVEVGNVKSWIASHEYLALLLRTDPIAAMRGGNKFNVLECCSWTDFAQLLGAKFFLPLTVVEELLLPVMRHIFAAEYSAAVYHKMNSWGGLMGGKSWLVLTKRRLQKDFPVDVKLNILETFPEMTSVGEESLQKMLGGNIKILGSLLQSFDGRKSSPFINSDFLGALKNDQDRERWALHKLWQA